MEKKHISRRKTWLPVCAAAVILAGVLFYMLTGSREVVPEYVFTYAENQTADYPTTMGGKHFAELVEERTQGRIRILIYAESVMGSESEVIRQMQYGGIDFARISIAQIVEYVPEMSVLQMPYLYEDSAHMWRVLDGDIGNRFLEYPAQCDLIGLSWYDAGARNFYMSDIPARSLEDMRGLHIRVQESDMMSDLITALGATPIQIPYDRVYEALERGQVDGAENNLASYVAMQHYEVAEYYTVDEHIRIPEMQVCARHTWDQLSESDREILRECAIESARYERTLWTEYEEQARETARINHVQEIHISDEEKKKFQEAVLPVYEKYCEGYEGIIAQIQAAGNNGAK